MTSTMQSQWLRATRNGRQSILVGRSLAGDITLDRTRIQQIPAGVAFALMQETAHRALGHDTRSESIQDLDQATAAAVHDAYEICATGTLMALPTSGRAELLRQLNIYIARWDDVTGLEGVYTSCLRLVSTDLPLEAIAGSLVLWEQDVRGGGYAAQYPAIAAAPNGMSFTLLAPGELGTTTLTDRSAAALSQRSATTRSAYEVLSRDVAGPSIAATEAVTALTTWQGYEPPVGTDVPVVATDGFGPSIDDAAWGAWDTIHQIEHGFGHAMTTVGTALMGAGGALAVGGILATPTPAGASGIPELAAGGGAQIFAIGAGLTVLGSVLESITPAAPSSPSRTATPSTSAPSAVDPAQRWHRRGHRPAWRHRRGHRPAWRHRRGHRPDWRHRRRDWPAWRHQQRAGSARPRTRPARPRTGSARP